MSGQVAAARAAGNARVPLYKQLKNHIRGRILSGEWEPDHQIPSENELVRAFGASRMTVNRAVRELTDEGWLRRVQGRGTFVSDSRAQLDLLEIRNIRDVIEARGVYSNEQHAHTAAFAEKEVADALGLEVGATVYHTRLVHLQDGEPVQLEDRYVNPSAAPDYLSIDLAEETPNHYLMRAAPLREVEHRLEAVLPTALEQQLLHIGPTQPCLLVHRRTFSGPHVASRAWLTHPGHRFYLSTRFAHERSRQPNAE